MKRKVLIIYTGGTIGMAANPKTGSLMPLNFEHLSKQIPELNQMPVHLSVKDLGEPIDSSNVTPAYWKSIAEMIKAEYSNHDGFVILHGTDTMAYTASALSFMLQPLGKPIVLTGSQLPIGVIRTDGKENLITSIEIAADYDEENKPKVPEVCIYFENRLLRGNRTRKFNSENFEAFDSPNYPDLAQVGININYDSAHILFRKGTESLGDIPDLLANIFILKLFPGLSSENVKYLLSNEKIEGFILESFGAGNASTNEGFLNEIEATLKRGIPIVNVTQCYAGSVMQGKYDTSKRFLEMGVISGHDLTTEAACTKLMFALGKKLKLNEIKKLFQKPLVGESFRKESFLKQNK